MSKYNVVKVVIFTIVASVVLVLCAVAPKGVLVATNILLLVFLCGYLINSLGDKTKINNLNNILEQSEHHYKQLFNGVSGAIGYFKYDKNHYDLVKEVKEALNSHKAQLMADKETKDAENDKLIAAFKKTVPIGSQFTYLGLKAIVVGYYIDINGGTPDVGIEVLREDGEGKQVIDTKYLDAEILYKMFPIN